MVVTAFPRPQAATSVSTAIPSENDTVHRPPSDAIELQLPIHPGYGFVALVTSRRRRSYQNSSTARTQ